MPRYHSSFDGARLFYRDLIPATKPPPFGPSPESKAPHELVLVFLHQWLLSSRMYDPLLLDLCEAHRMRCIALDRRGHGQSDWAGLENQEHVDYDILSRDVIDFLEKVNPGPFIFLAASMGTGETLLAYANSHYVKTNCKGFFWISTSLPCPVASSENPNATPREAWDMILKSLRYNRSQFVSANFQGPLEIGTSNNVSDKDLELFERMFDVSDSLAIERCVQIFISEDLTDELMAFGRGRTVPLLLVHGGADEGVPLAASAERIQDLVPGSRLILYDDGGHVLVLSHMERL